MRYDLAVDVEERFQVLDEILLFGVFLSACVTLELFPFRFVPFQVSLQMIFPRCFVLTLVALEVFDLLMPGLDMRIEVAFTIGSIRTKLAMIFLRRIFDRYFPPDNRIISRNCKGIRFHR